MPQPTKIPVAFADTGDKNTIPQSTVTPGLASWSIGFPPITSTPFANGGLAPKRADFNGIFNALSAAAIWQQQGGVFAYDNVTDYEVGNIVVYSGDIYVCLVANGPNSTVKAPTDDTVWDRISTFSTSDRVLDFVTSGYNTYIQFSSGLEIALGACISSSSPPVSVTFASPFHTSLVRVMLTNDGSSNTVVVGKATNISTTGFDFYAVVTAGSGYVNGATFKYAAFAL